MRRRYFAMGLAILVILFVPLFIFTGQNAGGKLAEASMEAPYQYPITPADEAWADFKASQETFNALFSEKAQVRKEQSSIYSGAGGAYAAFAG